MKTILITGALGWTATAIIQRLKQNNARLIGVDLPDVPLSPDITPYFDTLIRGDIADFQQVDRAMQGVDAVVHLAVALGNAYGTPDLPFATNVKGTYNVFEAARQHAIEKVILMSSAPVHLFPLDKRPFRAGTDWQSSSDGDYLYDLTKRLQEEIARDFCQTFGMNSIVLRAGHIVDGRAEKDPKGSPLSEVVYCRGGWVCRYDLATACAQALHQTLPGYNAYHVIGAWQARDMFEVEKTEQALGFQFQTRFEAY
ncbi:MAG: NAD(P)-dependent oxidoreductase [Anaerolineales bacterium]|nr:NAD(P)-dependent oxidoreductase [Anaerolineales bacterium]